MKVLLGLVLITAGAWLIFRVVADTGQEKFGGFVQSPTIPVASSGSNTLSGGSITVKKQ